MNKKHLYIIIMKCLILLIFILLSDSIFSQYVINKLPFCNKSNEFSPVLYNNDLIFSSNKNNIINYVLDKEDKLINLYYATEDNQGKWHISKSKVNKEFVNTSSAAISKNNLYYTRNIKHGENLGIFYTKGIFNRQISKPFPLNSNNYNIMHPTLNSKGDIMIYSSNKDGDYDLYMTKLDNGKWSEGINLGTNINTMYNEAFPFLYKDTILYYATNDPNYSKGGYDIVYSIYDEGKWSNFKSFPQLNTEADEFGLIFDNSGIVGYYNSNKDGSDDIYKILIPFKDSKCEEYKNEICYNLENNDKDTLVEYSWNTGDGEIVKGKNIRHCYDKVGIYFIKQIKTDKNNQSVEKEYYLKVEANQPNIIYPRIVNKNQDIYLQCLFGDLNYAIKYYWWDLGDNNIKFGKRISYKYSKKGEYTVKLLIIGYSDERMCYSFKIKVI